MVKQQNRPITSEPPDLEGFDDHPNRLLKESKSDNDHVCLALPQPSAGPADSALVVTASHSVDEVINWWDRSAGGQGKLGIISIGDAMRSITTPTSPGSTIGSVSFAVIPSPLALDDLGYAVDDHLAILTDGGPPVRVCFRALDSLLEHTHQVRVLRFIAGIMARCHTADVTAHYHLTPAMHDDKVVSLLESLFPEQFPVT